MEKYTHIIEDFLKEMVRETNDLYDITYNFDHYLNFLSSENIFRSKGKYVKYDILSISNKNNIREKKVPDSYKLNEDRLKIALLSPIVLRSKGIKAITLPRYYNSYIFDPKAISINDMAFIFLTGGGRAPIQIFQKYIIRENDVFINDLQLKKIYSSINIIVDIGAEMYQNKFPLVVIIIFLLINNHLRKNGNLIISLIYQESQLWENMLIVLLNHFSEMEILFPTKLLNIRPHLIILLKNKKSNIKLGNVQPDNYEIKINSDHSKFLAKFHTFMDDVNQNIIATIKLLTFYQKCLNMDPVMAKIVEVKTLSKLLT